ncbi:hypothetical protein ACFOTA_04260 [Chitinophaga sp. GCM10012297]|uniref:2TM domain-containing protein n=1 Tax=Chitinophaga chungangae TaxID=2821488 RepID=A0ABS3Y9Q3_9BACT|nr:hypothetical protein [Chitinophaga chungangae]MBO9151407.1 hypothetical protein [Chitinophaga chungangae]
MTEEKLHEHALYAVEAGKGKKFSDIPALLARKGLQPWEVEEVMELLAYDNARRNLFNARQYLLYSGLAVLVLVLYNVLMFRLAEGTGKPWWEIALKIAGSSGVMWFCYATVLTAFTFTLVLFFKRMRALSALKK